MITQILLGVHPDRTHYGVILWRKILSRLFPHFTEKRAPFLPLRVQM